MNNNKQQTAVEWLVCQLQKTRDWQRVINEVNQSSTSVRNVLQQAKEMEKEQAIKLHYEYELYVMMNESVIMTFGQFYKQTYGGGEQ